MKLRTLIAISALSACSVQTAPATTTTTTSTSTTTSTTTTTTTTTIVQVRSKHKTCGIDIINKLAEYGLPADPFAYIAWRESRCNPGAVNATWNKQGVMTYALNKNKTWDSGLLQINSGHRETVRRVCGKAALINHLQGLRDLDCNLAVARVLYDNGKGLGHWRATYKQGN